MSESGRVSSAEFSAGYLTIQGGDVARTMEVAPGVLVDVDAEGRILGIESIGKVDFYAAAFDVLRLIKVNAPASTSGKEPRDVD